MITDSPYNFGALLCAKLPIPADQLISCAGRLDSPPVGQYRRIPPQSEGHGLRHRFAAGTASAGKTRMTYHAVWLSIGAALAFLSAKQRVKSPICSHFPACRPLASDDGIFIYFCDVGRILTSFCLKAIILQRLP
jgi:hypothetical protein